MRFNVHSPHWADGGTGITNFGLASLALYDEAVRRYVEKTGDRSYIVCDVAMGGAYTSQKIKDTMGSLHRADASRAYGCGDFWNVFHATKQEREREEARQSKELAEKKRIEELAAVEKAAREQDQRMEEYRVFSRQRAQVDAAIDVIRKRLEEQRALEVAAARKAAIMLANERIIAQEKLHVRLGRWHVTLVVDADGKLHVKSELLTPFQEKTAADYP